METGNGSTGAGGSQSANPGAAVTSTTSNSGYMSEEEQDGRRKQIKDIMNDPNLTQAEKSRAIQQLMDGRRKSMTSCASQQSHSGHSYGNIAGQDQHSVNSSNYATTMARAAAHAHDYYSSDEDDGDAIMSDAGSDDGAVMAGVVGPGGGTGGAGGGPYYGSYSGGGGGAVFGAAPDDISYGYGYDRYDERSVASSVTHTSFHSNADFPSGSNHNSNNNNNNSSSRMNTTGGGGGSGGGMGSFPAPGTYKQVHGRSYSLQDWNEYDRVAAAANTSFLTDNPAQISRLMEQSRPQCEHYDRNCTVVAPCCGLAFGCRICHDECPSLPKPLALRGNSDDTNMLIERLDHIKSGNLNKMERRRSMPLDFEDDDENHHNIDRFAIREVICRSCYTRQSSKTNNCINCKIQFGEYHCNICNLWMSARESPYHCLDCGFCRVGGRENFRHCDDCGMCIDALLFDDHNCKAGKYMSNCPVCQEDLFSSRYASHEMPCGHAIHWHCFKELTSYDTRCPVCKKTAETPEHMASTWSAIAMGIALQPVPPDMARVVNIICNDCETPDTNRRWHFLGVRCMHCLSFNTNCEQIVMQGRDAAAFLDELEASRSAEDGSGVPQNIAVSAPPSNSISAAPSDGGGGATGNAAAPSNRRASNNTNATSQSMDEDTPSAQETSSGSTDPTHYY